MVASLLKIVSTGMQDERLQPPKDQPDLGAFLTVMVKTGRYATNWSRIDFDTKPEFGSRAVIRLPTKGEMIGRIYLVTVMPDIRTQQQVAYYTRKPIRLANSNYTSFNMYEVGGYITTTTFICQPSSDIYGYANFTGIQLDDLIVDGVYSLTFTVPVGAFSLLLTNRALNTSQFDILNSDTLMILGGAEGEGGAGTNFLLSSYNGTQFQTIEAPQNITSGGINDIAYNNTNYLAVGVFYSATRRIVIENPPNTTVTVSTDGYAYNIAFNGTIYVGVGAWATGSMIWSNDGLTWSNPVWPADVASGQGNSVAWIASRNLWMAVGTWPTEDPTGIISTSTDGKVWTAPTFIDTVPPPEFDLDYIRALQQGPGGILPSWITAKDNPINISDRIIDVETSIQNNIVTPFQDMMNAIINNISLNFYNVVNGNRSTINTNIPDITDDLTAITSQLNEMLDILTNNSSYTPPIPPLPAQRLTSAQEILIATITALQIYSKELQGLVNIPGLSDFISPILSYINQIQANSLTISNYIIAHETFVIIDSPYSDLVSYWEMFVYQFDPPLVPSLNSKLNTALLADPNGDILNALWIDNSNPAPQFPTYNPVLMSYTWTIGFATDHSFLVGNVVTLNNFGSVIDSDNSTVNFGPNGTITAITATTITISIGIDNYVTSPTITEISDVSLGPTIIIAISVIAAPNNIWRFYLGAEPHKFTATAPLSMVVLADFNPSGFNGEKVITGVTVYTITILFASSLSYPTFSGTITLKNGNVWYDVIEDYNLNNPNNIGNTVANLGSAAFSILAAFDVFEIDIDSLLNLNNNILSNYSSITNLNTYLANPTNPIIISGSARSIAVNGSNVAICGTMTATYSVPNVYTGTITYSSDGGVTWIVPTNPGGRIIIIDPNGNIVGNDVAWTGSIWAVTGKWSANTISVSEDGINWLDAVNPLNTSGGIGVEGKAIALNGTEMIIGGNWPSGNLTKASGTSLGAKWGTIIRPTDLDTNAVDINNVIYYSEGATTVYLLLGKWSDSTGVGFGTISASTNGTVWSSPAVVGNDTSLTNSRAYAAATNGTIWIAVGSWKTPAGAPVSIAISDNISGESWGNTQPFNPGSVGEGYGIIYSQETIFIAVGSWISGYITISSDDGNIWSVPDQFTVGEFTYTGTAYSIIETAIAPTATSKRYIIVGTFIDGEPDSLPKTIATVDIDDAGAISSVSFINISSTSATSVAYSAAWNGLSDGQALYVAVGQWPSGSIIYSTDLISWSAPLNPAGVGGIGKRVAWNGTQFVATGDWTTGSVTTSVDGITWATPSRPPNIVNNIATGAIWNGSTWLVSGNFINSLGIGVGNLIPFSYGINFTLPVYPDTATSGNLFDVAWIPEESKWIGYGVWSKNNGDGYITRSSDGLSWSSPESIPFVSGTAIDGLSQLSVNVINTRIYLLGEFTLYPTMILSSPTGSTWSSIVTNFAGQARCVVWNGSLWVVGGDIDLNDFNNSINGTIITSTDGITWSSPINPPIPQTPRVLQIISDHQVAANLGVELNGELFNLAWNGSLFVGVGSYDLILGSISSNITFGIGQIITSPNGVDWTIREIASITALNDAQLDNVGYGVAWNGYLWVAVGSWYIGNENYATITTSTDGINWTQPISPPNILTSSQSDGRDITWNGYIWVAVGQWIDNDSNILIISTSTDGIVWSNATNPLSPTYTDATLLSITWNGTIFIATGLVIVDEIENISNGIIMRSEDGVTWSYTINSDMLVISAVVTKRSLPYTNPQTFDPTLSVYPEPSSPGNYRLSWLRNPIYGSGSQYMQNQNVTQTFTAIQRTQWLTFGTYYNTETPVTITLNKISPENPVFNTDLVGPYFGWTNNLGHSIVDTTSLTIGGNLVETLSGQLMEVIDEFQTPLEKVNEKNRQLCRSDNGFTQTTYGYSNVNQTVTTHLPFWFSRGDPGCALPIDALNVDEVRLTVNFKPVTSLYYTDSRAATPVLAVEGGSLQAMANSPFYYEDSSGSLMPNIEPNRPINNPLLAFPNLKMTSNLAIQESYLIVEYIYLDKAEANRFRIADIQVPVVQHYILNPQDTQGTTYARLYLDIPNPTRDLFFFCQRYEAPSLNAHFLATKDLYKGLNKPYGLWWPDASGLDARLYGNLRPGFSRSGSEPIRWLALNYNETLTRYSTENVAVFRSLLPSTEQRKAPWINRYYYNMPLGLQNGLNPFSTPLGEANLDKVKRLTLSLGFHGKTGDPTDVYVERFLVRVFAETYNILRIYGGRGTTMFAY